MKSKAKLLTSSVAFALSLGTGLVVADDTEIFFNTTASEIRPNILFVLDNSGSMAADVTTTSSYDSSQTYSGDAEAGSIWYLDQNTLYGYPAAANKCNDITERFQSTGRVIGYRMASWRSDRWRDPSIYSSSRGSSNFLECEHDSGLHGETESSNTKYARNHGSQWGNQGQEIRWSQVNANTFWSANYVNWYFGEERVTTTRTRLEIVQEVSKNLADSLSGVNIGLMAFNPDGRQRQGGRVLVSVDNIEDNRETFKTAVDLLGSDTWTPLSETLFGAMRYFGGASPFLDTSPVAGTVQDGNYVSPVEYECQSNNIIMLTDGEPTYDGDPTSPNYNSTEDANSRTAMEGVVGSCTGNCLDEISEYMYGNDVNPGFDGEINVNTYTVGFQTDQPLLSDTASNGGGEYYLANDTESLENAFESFVRSVLAVNTTFVAPGVAVNTFNRLNHLDSLYFSVFQPDVSPRWDGNLKRYRLGSDGKIYDSNGSEAINDTTGFFKNDAQSWWSPDADGPNVAEGGASSQQADVNADRKVFTHYSGASDDLTALANSVSVANKANLTKTMFGDANMSDAMHEKLLNWTRGLDVDDEDGDASTSDARKYIADPLHSVPHLVIYGGSSESPDTTVFFGDNQGFIHAIDGNSGETFFSFMPGQLLANQQTLMENSDSVTDHVYGMDGSIVSWQYDDNNDGEISATDDDHLYIYSGMRRGGRNYYALDVTTRTTPQMLWSITGGQGDFAELGQSWSKPVKTKIKIQNAVKEVIIFSGGYDVQQDDLDVRTADSVGRALYIVDASSGQRLWWAGPTGSGADLELADMDYSIPASPRALDLNGDGLVNQVYVGDMGGQIWRFDIYSGEATGDLVTAGVIADFGGDTAQSNRRFYHTPDLFGLKSGAGRSLGMVIGSGWQAHPLSVNIDDRIYMVRIANVNEPPPLNADGEVDYPAVKVTEADLFDTTDNLIGQGTDTQRTEAQSDLAAEKGWYISLTRNGEKILSTSQTVNGQTFITSYEPTPSSNACLPSAGTARLYHVYVKDGTPVVNYDNLGGDELTSTDREVTLDTVGLPPDPQRMRVDGEDIICVGAECRPVDTVTGVVETYWYEE